jgi:ribosomal protein L35
LTKHAATSGVRESRKEKEMPKQKPCKALVKRVRVTRQGKVMAKGAGGRHKRVVKSSARRRRLSKVRPIEKAAARQIRQGLGLI